MLRGTVRRSDFPPLLPCVPATPPRFNNLYSKPVSWSGLASAPHPAGALGLKAGQKKCLRGEKVGDRNACDPCQLTSVFSSQAATDEQEHRDKKRKGEKPVGDHKSTEKLEAEICWAFIPRVSTLTENPNHVMSGRGSHCVLILEVDSNSSILLFQEITCPVFSLNCLLYVSSSTQSLLHHVAVVQECSRFPGCKDLCTSSSSVGIQYSLAAKTTN